MVPHDLSKFFVEIVYSLCSIDVAELGQALFHFSFSCDEFLAILIDMPSANLMGQIITYGVRKDEVAISQSLHQS